MYFAFIIQLSPKKSTLALQEGDIKNCCPHDRKNVKKNQLFLKKDLTFSASGCIILSVRNIS